MERSSRVAVVPCAPGWSDVGSWHAIWEIMAQDEAGNALRGDALVVDGRNNLVRSEGRLVALAGVDDLAVIETADAVMVAGREAADAVKALVGRLTAADRPEASRHWRLPLEWGTLTRLVERSGYALCERLIDPGAVVELEAEATQGAVWTVVEGALRLEAGGEASIHAPGVSVGATAGVPHRLGNPGSVSLRLVELRIL
jgi:mannose-6-phosphate isomerase-like protein (cupin superfamily)